LGKPKSFQVEEDKVLLKVIFSMIYQIMSLTWKGIGGGIGYPTRPSQSKGTSPRLGGRALGESKTLLFRRCSARNANNMVERHITLQNKSWIDWILHRYNHLFNHWLNRMHDNKARRCITFKNWTVIR
jgi:hypothetical protein